LKNNFDHHLTLGCLHSEEDKKRRVM